MWLITINSDSLNDYLSENGIYLFSQINPNAGK